MPAHLHRDRRGRHEEVHDTVADGARRHGNDVLWLRNDLAQRPAAGGLLARARRRDADMAKEQHGRDRERDEHEVRAHELRRERVDGPAARGRADDAADQAAGEDERNRGGPEIHRRDIRGDEAVVLAVRVEHAEDKRPEAKQPEALRPDRGRANERPYDAPQRAAHEPALAAHPLHVERRRHRGDRAAEHPTCNRQRGEASVGRKRQPSQAVDGDQRGVVREEQCLARREQTDVARGTVHIYSIGMQKDDPRYLRGARSFVQGRFESVAREAFDDGWTPDEPDTRELKTFVTIEKARSIISRNDSPDVGFSQSINPYRGCEHGCIYCYARPSHAYLELSLGLDFETKLFANTNAAELLRDELMKQTYKPSPIALGANTDCYQPIERKYRITRQVLEVLSECDHPVTIVTKSALVERDLDLLAPMAKKNLVRVFVSIGTLDRELARKLEPRA